MSTPLDSTVTTVEGDVLPSTSTAGHDLVAVELVARDGDGDDRVVSAVDPMPVRGTFRYADDTFNAFIDVWTDILAALEALNGDPGS